MRRNIKKQQKEGPPHSDISSFFFVLLLLFCINGHLFAQNKDKLVSIECEEESLSTVLNKVERLSGYYKMNFNYDELNKYKVTASVKQNTVPKTVETLLRGLPLKKTINGQFIIIQPAQIQKQKKMGTVEGLVLDSDKQPLPGALIRIKDTTKGGVTDNYGHFTLTDIEEGSILLITYIGKKEISLNVDFKPLTIIMEDEVNILSDVVVTGYQTISRERSTGAFNIVTGGDIASKSLITNSIIEGLEGLTTSLNINRNTGADKYLIRGTTSINSSRSPLFVVDGVPLDESMVEDMINGNDIRNITVLKDATAASIWGSQAANGVVVISTKHGIRNQKAKVTYNGSFTFYGKPDHDYYNYMDSKTFMKNAQEIFDEYSDTYTYDMVKSSAAGNIHTLSYNGGYIPVVWPHEELMYQYKDGTISASERDAGLNRLIGLNGRSQYEEYFMSDKLFTKHNVSIQGGDNMNTYFLSLTYKGDQGTTKDWTDNFTINAYQDFQFTDWLKWDITLNANFGNSKSKLSPWYLLGENMNYSSGAKYYNLPYNIFKDENGWVDQSPMVLSADGRSLVESSTGLDMGFYPIDDFNSSVNNTTSSNIRLNSGLGIDLIKGLRYEGRFQYSRFNSKTETYLPSDTYLVREERAITYDTSTSSLRVPATGGHYGLTNALTTDWTLRNQFVYDNSFNEKEHQLTALAGTEIRSYITTSYMNRLRGYNMQTMQALPYDNYALRDYISPVIFGYYSNVMSETFSQSEISKKYFSLYANAAYTFNQKYILNSSIRVDQSNLFGSDPANQYKPIWSLGTAWKISDEPFMGDFDFLNNLMLRASFGLAGNSPVPGSGGRYNILSATTSYYFESFGYDIVTPANDKLTWEKTRTINAGFDVSLIDNRISLSFDYYDKYTKDLIGLVNLNPTTGWLSTIGNLSEMSNRGFEINLNTHNIKTKDLNWSSILTLSYNKNKIEKIDVETPITLATDLLSQTVVEGYPMGSLFSYRYAGLDSEGRPQAYTKNGEIVTGTSTENLTKDDMVFSGSTVPKYYGGLTNRISYKNAELSLMFIYNLGHKMRKDGLVFYGRLGNNLLKEYDNRWRNAGDETTTDIPRYSALYDTQINSNVFYNADTRILDASYIKLRDISLNYYLPSAICRKMGAENIKISAQMGNLFLIAFNGENIDPEAYSFTSGNYTSRQEKFGSTYSLGFNINF